jgi:hypothetical protein
MPRPKGRPLDESHAQNIRNAWREPAAGNVELADPEEIQAGLASAVREGRVPPRYVSEIIRLMPIPLPDDEEEEEQWTK